MIKRIQSNEFPPGSEIPSVIQLSVQYNAGTATVQRAVIHLRERGYIETNSRGSRVVENPPHLCHFGLVLPFYAFHSQFVTALRNEAEIISETISDDGIARKFSIFKQIEHPGKDILQHHEELVAAVQNETVGGLFFAGPTTKLLEPVKKLNPDIPCVGYGNLARGQMDIISDSFLVRAVGELAKRGRKRAALMVASSAKGQDYVDHFMNLLHEHNMTSLPRWVHGLDISNAHWASTCAEMLMATNDKPDSLIIDDDNLVPYATAGIAASGIGVPGELTIVAHTNFPYPTRSEVPAVRLGTDIRRMMKLAIERMERIRRGETVERAVLPVSSEEDAMH